MLAQVHAVPFSSAKSSVGDGTRERRRKLLGNEPPSIGVVDLRRSQRERRVQRFMRESSEG